VWPGIATGTGTNSDNTELGINRHLGRSGILAHYLADETALAPIGEKTLDGIGELGAVHVTAIPAPELQPAGDILRCKRATFS